MRRSEGPAAPQQLVVDPVACDGVGMCTQLAPDVVTLDSWGYPMTPARSLSPAESRQAERAVAGCPRRALLLVASHAPATTRR
jgi:ferredoxin